MKASLCLWKRATLQAGDASPELGWLQNSAIRAQHMQASAAQGWGPRLLGTQHDTRHLCCTWARPGVHGGALVGGGARGKPCCLGPPPQGRRSLPSSLLAPKACEPTHGPLFSAKFLIIKVIPTLAKTENSIVYMPLACPLTWLSLPTTLCGGHGPGGFHICQGHTAGEWRPRDWRVVSRL